MAFARTGVSLGAPRASIRVRTIETDRIVEVAKACPPGAGDADLTRRLEEANQRIAQMEEARGRWETELQSRQAKIVELTNTLRDRPNVNVDRINAEMQARNQKIREFNELAQRQAATIAELKRQLAAKG